MPELLDMAVGNLKAELFINAHGGIKAIGCFKEDRAVIASAGMGQHPVHQSAPDAVPARFGQQHKPAQLANLAPVHQRGTANRGAIALGKPDTAARRLAKLCLGHSLANKAAKGFAKAWPFACIAAAVHLNDQRIVAMPPVMPVNYRILPHIAGQ